MSGCWECERAVIVLGPDSKLHFECGPVSSTRPSCPAHANDNAAAVEGVLRPSETGLSRSAQCGDEPLMSDGDDERLRRLKRELELIKVWELRFGDDDEHAKKARKMRRREILRELRDARH